jgi:hypothetical protein
MLYLPEIGTFLVCRFIPGGLLVHFKNQTMENFNRREFIKMSTWSLAALLTADLNHLIHFGQKANATKGYYRENEPLNWDAFLSKLTRQAQQHKVGRRSEKHVRRIADLLRRLDLQTPVIQDKINAYNNSRPNWFEHDLLHQEVNFQVSLIQFEKGEYIPHHDHPAMCGVIFPVNGELEVKNFDLLPDEFPVKQEQSPDGISYQKHTSLLRLGQNETLRKGSVSTLTEEAGNIHSVMPTQFSQVIDIFTPAYNDTNSAAARWFQVDETATYEGKDRIYRAEWYKPV